MPPFRSWLPAQPLDSVIASCTNDAFRIAGENCRKARADVCTDVCTMPMRNKFISLLESVNEDGSTDMIFFVSWEDVGNRIGRRVRIDDHDRIISHVCQLNISEAFAY